MNMEGSDSTDRGQNEIRSIGPFSGSVARACQPERGENWNKAGKVPTCLAPALLCLLASTAFLGMFTATAPSQEKPRASAVSQEKKPHPPLFGKACVDCHKQEVSEKTRCLVAREPLCVLCHDIPEAGGVAKLINTDSPLCLKCHSREKFKGSYNHGPFVFGACVACHNPHGGSEPRMLRVSGRQLCLTCHRDIDAQFSNAPFRHKALATGCTDCHSPHTSDQRFELKAPVPVLCSRCHETMYHDQETARVKHSPMTEGLSCMSRRRITCSFPRRWIHASNATMSQSRSGSMNSSAWGNCWRRIRGITAPF
jgi:predicted CXXCH cytochrome family protein